MANINQDAINRIGSSGSIQTTNDSTENSSLEAFKKRLEAEEKFKEQLRKKYNLKELKENQKALQELDKYKAALDNAARRKQKEEDKAFWKEQQKMLMESADKFSDRLKASLNLSLLNLDGALKKIGDAADVTDAANFLSQYQSSINARLQGSSQLSTFQQIAKDVRQIVGTSQFVSQKKILENIATYVKSGINYNVEQRAFLATIAEDIAETFDANTESLRKIIRIQQQDSTAARLGMEAYLTKAFNNLYQDTSYLTEVFDTVSSNILDASAQMNAKQAVEFEYITQKWLGALGSVGVSGSSLSSLASGLNALGSGNLESLVSNQAMNSLLAISMQRGNLSYNDLITGGLTASTTNELLRNMVGYLKEIADQDNLVVKSKFASLFGLTITDLTSIANNLAQTDIDALYKSTLSYNQALGELSDQISQIPNRLHASERIQNVMNNLTWELGETIASTAPMYITWMVADMMQKSGADINIPIPWVGPISTANTLKAGLVGGSLIANIGNVLTGITDWNANALQLSNWGGQETTSRGSGFATTTGTSRTVSQTSTVGGSTEGIAKETVEESYQGEKVETIELIYELLKSVADGSSQFNVEVKNYGLTRGVYDF